MLHILYECNHFSVDLCNIFLGKDFDYRPPIEEIRDEQEGREWFLQSLRTNQQTFREWYSRLLAYSVNPSSAKDFALDRYT